MALRDVLGLSYGEIAVLLEVPEGTVKSRIHEAPAPGCGRRRRSDDDTAYEQKAVTGVTNRVKSDDDGDPSCIRPGSVTSPPSARSR